MFITLPIVTFLIALMTSILAVRLFRSPINAILHRVVSPALSGAWQRYVLTAGALRQPLSWEHCPHARTTALKAKDAIQSARDCLIRFLGVSDSGDATM